MIKQYSIGRGEDCQIKLQDSSQKVSRSHATIKVLDNGKIFITDHSSNGTYVNMVRIPVNKDIPVKRKDKIVFSNVQPLDWNLIKEKQPSSFVYLIPLLLVIVLGIVLLVNKKNWFSEKEANIIIIPDTSSIQEVTPKEEEKIIPEHLSPSESKFKKEKVQITGTQNQIKSSEIEPQNASLAYSKTKAGALLSPEEIYKKYENAVVCIYHVYHIVAEFADGNKLVFLIDENLPENFGGVALYGTPEAQSLVKASTATAFFVDINGTMLTNRHVTMPWEDDVELAKRLEHILRPYLYKEVNTTFYKIYGETVYIGYVLNNQLISRLSDFKECAVISQTTESREIDLGILKTKEQRLPNSDIEVIDIKNAMIQQDKLIKSQKVYTMGYPLGLSVFGSLSSGTTNTMKVSITGQSGEINLDPNGTLFGVNVQMTSGASGSPVLNDKGQLIGVFNSGFTNTQGLNYAILAKHAVDIYNKVN